MKILSLDTSSDVLTVAVFDGNKKLAACESSGPVRHSEALAPAIKKVLKQAGVSLKEIQCIAVGVGPGSFAGLRAGLTTAKTLSYALKIKLIGISSLEARARTIKKDGMYAVMVDAKKSQVYAAVYRRKNGRWKTLEKPKLVSRDIFLRSVQPEARLVDSANPAASAVNEAALERLSAKKFDDALTLEPMYLHPKDCNVSRR